jgi:hypothetical protein
MSKNSLEGNRKRNATYREKLKQQGMVPIMLRLPEAARPVIHCAAALIRDGADPAEALRIAGGSNEEPLPDREALERLIEQITQDRDQLRQQQAHITATLIETQRQNGALLQALTEIQRQLAAMSVMQADRDADTVMGWRRLVRRWLNV